MVECRNERCVWFDTRWPVEIREDGSIPDPVTDRPKQFNPLPVGHEKNVVENLQQMHEYTMSENAEIKRP